MGQQQYCELLGSDYIGTIRRLGLITFRIATILSVLRLMDTSVAEHSRSSVAERSRSNNSQFSILNSPLVCSDTDFQTSMEILKVLIQHSAYVFRQLPIVTHTKTINPKFVLFQALPDQFDRAKYIEVATQLQIPESTAEKQITRYINAGLLIRQTHGSYKKEQ